VFGFSGHIDKVPDHKDCCDKSSNQLKIIPTTAAWDNDKIPYSPNLSSSRDDKIFLRTNDCDWETKAFKIRAAEVGPKRSPNHAVPSRIKSKRTDFGGASGM
jgi:hypothetical protein